MKNSIFDISILQMATAQENDPQQQFLVETMDQQDYATFLAGRQMLVATLNTNMPDYGGKHMLLDQAIKSEKLCSEGKK